MDAKEHKTRMHNISKVLSALYQKAGYPYGTTQEGFDKWVAENLKEMRS